MLYDPELMSLSSFTGYALLAAVLQGGFRISGAKNPKRQSLL
jgi:hypothetical protein